MKRIRKAARVTSVIAAAILTALVATVLSAPEEDRIAPTEALDSLSDQEEPGRQIDWDSLPAEVIAWVEVPDTGIDEPVVQATPDSPNAYLYRDVFGQGAYGTPYIDCECTIDSRLVVVYGHHMSDGTAFAEFADFIDEGFAREHSRIIVYKRSGEALELEVCAVDVVNASRERLVIDQEESLEKIVGAADLQPFRPSRGRAALRFHHLLLSNLEFSDDSICASRLGGRKGTDKEPAQRARRSLWQQLLLRTSNSGQALNP